MRLGYDSQGCCYSIEAALTCVRVDGRFRCRYFRERNCGIVTGYPECLLAHAPEETLLEP